MFRPRPSSLYTFETRRSANPAWLGVVTARAPESSPTLSASRRAFPILRLRGYSKSAVSASSTTVPGGSLLLIVFDGVSRAHVHDVGILTEFFARAALT
jgi:hypothetical protein